MLNYQNVINQLLAQLTKKELTKQQWLAQVQQLSSKLFDDLQQVD